MVDRPQVKMSNEDVVDSPTPGDGFMPQAENVVETEELHALEQQEYFEKLQRWVTETQAMQMTTASSWLASQMPLPRLTTAFPQHLTFECQLASVWKRMVAEFIDGFILFLTKFYVIIILNDGFDITLEHYITYLENPSTLFSFTTEVAVVEFISRMLIFMYESYFLYLSGATPGKKIMGLRVFMVEHIMHIPGRNTVYATPCQPLGWWRALSRSILKNIGLFIFPICYGFMMSEHSRPIYDHLTRTFVIDVGQTPLRLLADTELRNR